MNMAKVTTKTIDEESLWYQHLRNREYIRGSAPLLNQQHVITILVRGIAESFRLGPGESLYMGRFQQDNPVHIDLDLMLYDGERRGVSRVHARLDADFSHHLYIVDLNSTNGTFFVGQRLQPHVSTLLCDGDEIILGNLPIKICFD